MNARQRKRTISQGYSYQFQAIHVLDGALRLGEPVGIKLRNGDTVLQYKIPKAQMVNVTSISITLATEEERKARLQSDHYGSPDSRLTV